MPRTMKVESPGCPPLRALTFDELGLIKVVEARGGSHGSDPKVVERWGEPEPSRCVLAASIDDRKSNPLLAVARKCGTVEILNPLKGDVRAAISDVAHDGVKPEDDPIVGLHLFKSEGSDRTSGSCIVLTCTTKGNARIRHCAFSSSPDDSASTDTATLWKVCGAGNVLCSKVDASESYAVFGGKGVEVNVWDIRKGTKIWNAKPPPKNNLGIFTPTWFTSATFLCKDDHRKIVAGTNSHQVRLYDISAQRRPVISFDFRETAIKAVCEDLDGYTVYLGNGTGDLASFDMRTGKMLGSFLGKCSGSIRSIARHPMLPVIASCGLDSYLRLWDIKSRQPLSAVFLKQHLNAVVFDSNFTDEASLKPDPTHEAEDTVEDVQTGDVEAAKPLKKRKKKAAKEGRRKEGATAKDNGVDNLKMKKKMKKKRSEMGEGLNDQQ
ncbi:WD repeat-containing protein 74 isoform X2 [Punica granatum]|uniref:WD repeat-containing protein 74 isoform X2 n=1 Tax=Punica granatum TaxID=22663 RepID=A0A6P8EA25_PUNGR|nr:WD repeat-containing protein 74 isoform X2 [Punica granatum]